MSSDEKLLPLAAAVEAETGQRPHPSSCQRWRLHGIAGVKLETVRVGGRRMCSVESVRQFIAGVTSATDGEPVQARTPRQRQGDFDRADKELARQGI